MENSSAVTEACIFWVRKDLPQECNPTNYTWLRPIRECRCVQIIDNHMCGMCKFHKIQIMSEGFLWAEWLFLQVTFSQAQTYRMKWPEVLRHARLNGMALVLFTNGSITWHKNIITSHEKRRPYVSCQALSTIRKFWIVLNLWSENNDLLIGFLNHSNLFPVDACLTKAWDSKNELRDMWVGRWEGDRTRTR